MQPMEISDMQRFRRRTSSDILFMVALFCKYHDQFHGKKMKNVLDTGVHFGGPWDIFPEWFVREHLVAAQRAYGPERGGSNLLSLIAEVENQRWGTNYTQDNVAVMPGAWAGLEFALEEVMRLQAGRCSKNPVVVVGPTLYQMFHRPIWVYGMNVVGYDFTESLPHIPISMEEMAPIFAEAPRAIVISNPNNPDGRYFCPVLLRQVIARAEREGIYIILDEMQNCFPLGEAGLRYGSWIQSPWVIRLDSPSKRYGLAQHRVGWAIADTDLLGDRQHGMVGRMSGLMGNAPKPLDTALRTLLRAELAGDVSLTHAAQAVLLANEAYVMDRLDRMGGVYKVFPRGGCVNRAFAVHTSLPNDMAISAALIDRGTLMMPGSGYGYGLEDMVLRLTLAAPREQLVAGLADLEAVLAAS